MFSVEELRFAQKYPFSSTAKRVVRQSNLSLGELPVEVIERAEVLVRNALQGIEYKANVVSSQGLLLNEVLAFPVAKIIVSCIGKDEAIRKFSVLIAANTLRHLEAEQPETLFAIAADLSIRFDLSEGGQEFARVVLPDFFAAGTKDEFMKLVNKKVEKGKVVLSRASFEKFLSYAVEKNVLSSLPVDVTGIPKNFGEISRRLYSGAVEQQKKQFEGIPSGKVKPEFFPPCFKRLYSDILVGKKLGHIERFNLATFLLAVGMPQERVIDLYKATPNFDENTTRYHVARLAGRSGKQYSASSCSKLAEYGLRLPDCPCNASTKIKHPLQVYRKAFSEKDSPTQNEA